MNRIDTENLAGSLDLENTFNKGVRLKRVDTEQTSMAKLDADFTAFSMYMKKVEGKSGHGTSLPSTQFQSRQQFYSKD
jgi:hypothetical protein